MINKIVFWLGPILIEGMILGIIIRFLPPLMKTIEADDHRSLRNRVTAGGLVVTGLIWFIRLAYPALFFNQHDPRSNLFLLMAGPPFIAIFSIEYTLWPEIAKPDRVVSGPMSGYQQIEKSIKRRNFILTAIILSYIHTMCLMLVGRHP